MQAGIRSKTFKNDTSAELRSLAVIDLGNGLVKALIKAPGAKNFARVSFPSYVAETEQSNSDCLRLYTSQGFKTFLVGEPAAEIPMSYTGRNEQGKVDNSLLLTLHALRLAFGNEHVHEQALHCDVIFTSPSNKAYGSDISAQLQKVHSVTVPADAEVIGSEAKTSTVVIHRAIPLLEGHYAFKNLKLKSDAWLLDCGNRTLIATKVSPKGRILKRDYFGGCGVRGLSERITAREALTAYFKEHTPEKVIDFLFDGEHGDAVVKAISPDISACIADALAFISADESPRYLIGGGAGIPSLSERLSAKVVKNPQWANIQALADSSERILGA